MPTASAEDLVFQVQQLHSDLDRVISQERWGGATTYVSLYNGFLSWAKTLKPEIPLDPAPEPETIQLRGHLDPAAVFRQRHIDQMSLLDLFPRCGQLLAWLKKMAG